MGILIFSQPIRQSLTSIFNEQIQKIQQMFCFSTPNIEDFYKQFCRIDSTNKGYITMDSFIDYLSKDNQDFVELPYAEKLFILIKKEKQDQLFFQDFIMGFSTYCLMNNQSILQFVFDFIDSDGDQKITKKDLIKALHYQNPKTNNHIFFTNFIKEIQYLPLKEGKTEIDFDHFRQNSDKLVCLTWPAYRLQDRLRDQLLGVHFWYNQHSKVQKKQYQIKNNQKKALRMKQKVQLLTMLNTRRQDGPFFKQTIFNRNRGEISDDLKLSPSIKPPRKRSGIYIKGQFNYELPQQV